MSLALPPSELRETRQNSFWSRFNPFHRSELKLHGNALQEILDRAARPQELIRRHGLRRVLEFYEQQLLPTLHKQPTTSEVWQARITIGCWIVAMRATLEPDCNLLEDIERLNAELVQARFAGNGSTDRTEKNRCEQINRQSRKLVRAYLAQHLTKTASRLLAQGQDTTALEAYQALERLGSLSGQQRLAYARLLWRSHSSHVAAVPLYLRCLQHFPWDKANSETIQWNVSADSDFREMAQFVADQLVIDEQTHREQLSQRLFFNQLALCFADSPPLLSRYIGLAYLRLQQPERALSYLRHSQVSNQRGGIDAFYLGQALLQTQDFSAAVSTFEQSREQGYSPSRIASWLGMAYVKNQEYQKAFATFQQAEAELDDIQDSEFFLLWGRVSFLVHQMADAEIRFRRALELEPASWRSTLGLAACLAQQGQLQQAMVLLEPVVTQADIFAPAAYLLGRLLEDENHLPEAALCYRQALAIVPNDTEYRLALGVVLDESKNAESLLYLEQAAKTGVGGLDVLRRLIRGHYFRQGSREQGRYWLEQLEEQSKKVAKETPHSPVLQRLLQQLQRLHARDWVSQAVGCFNAGSYQEATKLWEQAAAILQTYELNRCLALALLADAAAHLRQDELTSVWKQIERAYVLAGSLVEARFLYGIAQLAQGDFTTACRQFNDLLADFPERQDYLLFRILASSLAGDTTNNEALPAITALSSAQQAHWACLQVLLAIGRGEFGQAAEQIDAWIEDKDAVCHLPRQPVNRLVALCKLRGTRTRKQRLVQFFEQLNTRYGEGYWNLALVLIRQSLITAKGQARAGEVPAEELQQCQSAYEALLKQANPVERQTLLDHYARFLLFTVCHHVQRGELKVALDILDRWQSLQTLPPALQRLQRVLKARLAKPSHEKAFALLTQNPDEACKVWHALLESNRNDLVALHHLACLAWSRAYDQVLAKRHDAAIPFWKEGLEYYRQLYANADYWVQLWEKGRALGQTANPFDEPGFQRWQEQAIYSIAQTLVELVFQVLAGKDLAERREADPEILTARSLLTVIQESSLKSTTVTRLSDELADHYLDPDPIQVPDFAESRSRRRAERVIDIDPNNIKARIFLVRGTTHQMDSRRREGDHNISYMVEKLESIRRHAEWLEKQRRSLSEEQRTHINSDLASYYYQLGLAKHAQGQEETERFNRATEPLTARTSLQRIHQHYQDSDNACQKSLEFDPVNPNIREIIDHHQNQYQSIQENFERFERLLGQLR